MLSSSADLATGLQVRMFDDRPQTNCPNKLESSLALGLACLASLTFPLIAACRSQEEFNLPQVAHPAAERRLETFDTRPAQAAAVSEIPALPAPLATENVVSTRAALLYLGKETHFSAAQAPELFLHSRRLAEMGISIVIVKTDENSLAISTCDRDTGYKCSRFFQISKQALFEITREKAPVPKELSEFLESFKSRGSLLVDSGDQVSPAFYQMTLKGAAIIPVEAVTFLMHEGWVVVPRHSLTPHALTTGKGPEQRNPSGRCVFAEKRIELGEYFHVNASVHNNSVASLYHEIGHAIFSKYVESNPDFNQRLSMALERDLNQLGTLGLHNDPADPELPLKLSYYGTVSEGFAESYKNMLCPSLGKERIMLTHFPTFYSTCQDIIPQMLAKPELLARLD